MTPPIRFRRALLLSAVAVGALASPMLCTAETADENKIRAALVYNSAKFIDWLGGRPGDEHRIALCVYAADDLYVAFKALEGRAVKSRTVSVIRLDPRNIAETRCNIFYIDEDLASRRASVRSLRDRAILTVGESREFAHEAGVMALVVSSNRMRFVINGSSAKAAGIKIGSPLLDVADLVSETHADPGAQR